MTTSESPSPGAPADEGFAALDWQGRPVNCADCPHLTLRSADACRPGHACVADRYARRIDRFFHWNPSLANAHLAHPYFEVRAIAAKHADLFRLPPLLRDIDETVRWSAVQRLPARHLEALAHDEHREVRIRVALRLAPTQLAGMIADPDYYVRVQIARRLPLALLPALRSDPDVQVRIEVARRLSTLALLPMKDDGDAAVRRIVAQRLPPALLKGLQADPDWQVRYEVALRAQGPILSALRSDPDEAVREAAAQCRPGPDEAAQICLACEE